MPSEPTPTLPHLPAGAAGTETLIRRFEADWLAGGRPAIDACLDGLTGERRRSVLVELIHAELELRLKAGEAARVEEYLGRFPELAGDKDALLDLIAAEYRQRRRREKNLSAGEFQARFPHLQTELASMHSRTMTESAVMNQPDLPSPAETGKGGRPGADILRSPPPASHVPPTVAQGEDQSRVERPAASPPTKTSKKSARASPHRSSPMSWAASALTASSRSWAPGAWAPSFRPRIRPCNASSPSR